MTNSFDYLDSDVFELLLIYVQKARMKRVFNEILENSNHYWCWRSKSIVWPHLNKIANYGYHDIMGTPISKIAYLENTGTSQQAEYTLIDDDFANISTINLNTTLNSPALKLWK